MNLHNKRYTGYFLIIFHLVNFVWMAFYPGLVQAQGIPAPVGVETPVTGTPYTIVNGRLVLPDNTAEMKSAINKGQMFGANEVNTSTLPTVNDSDTPQGYNPVTGLYNNTNDEQYTDETKTKLKNDIYIQQLFPGYEKQALDDYMNSLDGVIADPTLINDEVSILKQEFADVDPETTYTNGCKSLEGAEFRKCQIYLAQSSISSGLENSGKGYFAGANDEIMLASESLIDGDSPFYDELVSGDCKEITNKGDEEEPTPLTERKICIRQEKPIDQLCRAVRDVQTQSVATVALMDYEDNSKNIITNISGSGQLYAGLCGETQSSNEFEAYVGQELGDGYCIKIIHDFSVPGDGSKEGVLSCFDERISFDLQLGGSYDIDRVVTSIITVGYATLTSATSGEVASAGTQGLGGNCPYVDYAALNGAEIPNPEGLLNSNRTISLTTRMNADTDTAENYSGSDSIPDKIVIEIHLKPSNPEIIDLGRDVLQSTFLDDKSNYPQIQPTWLFGKERNVRYDVFDIDTYPSNLFLPANLRVVPKTATDYYQYSEISISCNSQLFEGTDGSAYIQGVLQGDAVAGFSCYYQTPCTPSEATGGWLEVTAGSGTCYKSNPIVNDCPIGTEPSNIYADQCVRTVGSPESCSIFTPATNGCTNPGSYRSENNPSQCYTIDEENCTSEIPLNFKTDILTYGRPANNWAFSMTLESQRAFAFQLVGDMHKIVVDSFKPDISTPNCQSAIDAYLAETYTTDAICLDELGSQVSTGIEYNNNSTIGLLEPLMKWGEDIDEPLNDTCWKAELLITLSEDENKLGGTPAGCAGLQGSDYDHCINNEYCTYDDINGQEVCYPLSGGDGRSNFENTCKVLEDNPRCTELFSETRCEEYSLDGEGNEVCVFSSVVFECESLTESFTLPGKEDVDIVCGGPIECMQGSCVSIQKEENKDFGEAAVMQQLAEEIKKNADCKDDPANCEIFTGETGTCSQPQMWGSQDCCDPDELGMGSMNIFATLKALDYLYDLGENETFVGFMAESWTGLSGFLGEVGAGQVAELAEAGASMITSTMTSATGYVSSAVSSMTDPISNAFSSVASDLGFSAVAAPTISGSVTAAASQLAVDAAIEKSIFSGTSQFIANGIYSFIDAFAPELAAQLFTVEAGVVTGLTNDLANELLGNFLNAIGVIMLVYSVYNLIVSLVFGCKQEDFQTTQKIKLLSTHYSHSYCDKDSILGCLSYKQVHCTYESPFTRIISEQIKKQMAKNLNVSEQQMWKNEAFKKTANCTGFTIDELNDVDWDDIDLSEYFEIMMAGYFEHDPNNLPEAFVASEKGAGGRTGTDAGITDIENMTLEVNTISQSADYARQNLKNNTMSLSNPLYMPWYKNTNVSPDSGLNCIQTCDAGFNYNSASDLCVKHDVSEVPGNKSCNAVGGFVYDATEDACLKLEISAILSGCQEGYVLDEVANTCTADVIQYDDIILTCPAGTILKEETAKCETTSTLPMEYDCSIHGDDYLLFNSCPIGSSYDVPSDKCLGTGIEEIPTRSCRDDVESTQSPILSCPVTETTAPTGDGICASGFSYNAQVDVCEKSAYTLDGDGNCTLEVHRYYGYACPEGEMYDPEADVCVLTTSSYYPVTKSCPDGFDMVNDVCIKTTRVPATPTCDLANGFVKVGEHCQKLANQSVEPNKTCPEGYHINESFTQCEKLVRTTALTPDCPTGYTLNGNVCESEVDEEQAATKVCNLGYEYNSVLDVCERISEYYPILSCDEENGFEYNAITGQCESITYDVMTATASCVAPKVIGTGIHANECVEIVVSDANYSCRNGFVYNDVTGMCHMQETVVTVADVTCPEGYLTSGGECIKVTQQSPDKSCALPSVYDPVRDVCLETVEVVADLIPFCDGLSTLVNGQCIEYIFLAITGTCLDPTYTYNESSKNCGKVVEYEVPPITICGSGSEGAGDGTCVGGYSIDAIPECPTGYFYDSLAGVCIQEAALIVAGIPQCLDDGFVYNATLKLCVKEDTYDGMVCPTDYVYNSVLDICLKQETRTALVSCPDGYAYDGSVCIKVTHSPFSCPADAPYDPIVKACVKDESLAAVLSCEEGFTEVDGNCVSDLTQLPICDTGLIYSEVSKVCEAPSPITVINSCPEGYFDNNGNCSKTETTPVVCHNGQTFDPILNVCSIQISEAAVEYCFLGADTGLDCAVEETQMPTCAADYHYSSANQRCEKITATQGTPYCPEVAGQRAELTPEGRCAYYLISQVQAGSDCPYGYTLDLGECIRFEYLQSQHFSCADGYYQEPVGESVASLSSQCLLLEAQLPICEAGYTFTDGYCRINIHHDYDLKCSSLGQVLDNGVCTANETQSINCPFGSAYSAVTQNCMSVIETDYLESCPTYYSVSNSQCVSSFTQTPSCNSGFAFNAALNICEASENLPQCSVGYTYDGALDKCTKAEELAANGNCDPEHFDTGMGCVAWELPTCSDIEYTFNGATDLCEKDETKPIGTYCLADEIDTGTGCVKVEAALCPSEHALNPVTDQCEGVEIIPAQYTCLAGEIDTGTGCKRVEEPSCEIGYVFVSVNNQCEKFESINANKHCESGWVDEGNGCKKYSAPICSDGYIYDDIRKECVDVVEYDLTFHCAIGDLDTGSGCKTLSTPECSEGYTYFADRDQCEKPESTPAEEICSGDSYNDGNGCTPFEAVLCPVGYSFIGGECTLTESKPANGICAQGIDNGSGCTITQTQVIPCLSGYSYNNSSNLCEKTDTIVAEGTCSQGSDTGSGCEILEDKEPPCTEGFTYDPLLDSCAKAETLLADGVCDEGVDTGGGCEISETQAPSCAVGFSYDAVSNQCSKTETQAASGECASGSDTGSGCEINEEKAPPCSAGYIYNTSTNLCAKSETQAATGYCTSGTDTGSGCSVAESKLPDCPNGYTYSNSLNYCTKSQVLAGNGLCSDGVDNGGGCNITETKAPPCAAGFTYNTSLNQCSKTEVVSAGGTCSSGTDTGDGCSSISTKVPPCPATYSYDPTSKKCKKTESVAANESCLAGYLDTGGGCKLIWEPTFGDCPIFSEWDGGIGRCAMVAEACYEGIPNCSTPKVPHCNSHGGGAFNFSLEKCVADNQIDYTLSCGAGFSLLGSTCTRVLLQTVDCGAGWTFDSGSNQCTQTSEGGYTGYECPDASWTLTGQTCTKITNVAVNCGIGGWSLNTSLDKCTRVITGSYTGYECPDASWTLSGNTCYRTLTASADCGTWFLNTSLDRCTRSVFSPYSDFACPDGSWSLVGQTCSRVLTHTVSCGAGGWFLDTTLDKCVRTIDDTYTGYSCPDASWTLTGQTCEREVVQVADCGGGDWALNPATDQCERTVVEDYSNLFCPDASWTLNGNICERVELVAVYCGGDGWSLDPVLDKCTRTIVGTYTGYECPDASWTLTGQTCTKLFTHTVDCGAGWAHNTVSDRCEKEVVEDYSSFECDAGWTLNGEQCTRTLTQPPTCPTAGFTYNAANLRCEGPSQPYQYSCLNGWSLSGTTCSNTAVEPASCPVGYTIDYTLDKCVRNVETSYLNNCTVGFIANITSMKCEKEVLETPICSPGLLNEATDQCESALLDYLYDCDPGWGINGNLCERTLISPVDCSPTFNYLNSSKKCETVERDYDRTCLNGWTLNGTNCERPITAPLSCPTPGYVYNNTSNYCESTSRPHDLLCGDLSWIVNGGTCERTLTQAPYCSAGLSYNGTTQQCEGPDLGYNYGCPNDVPAWTVNGNLCQRTLIEDASCDAGYQLIDDMCTFVETIPKTLICLDQTYTLVGSTCEKIINIAVDCGVGVFEPSNNSCVITEDVVAELQCGESWSLVGNQCKKSNVTPRVLECNEGYSLFALTGECKRADYNYPTYFCNGGYTLMNDGLMCERITTQTLPVDSYHCGDTGFTLEGDQCVSTNEVTVCENAAHDLVNIAPGTGDPEYVCRYQEYLTQPAIFNCPSDYSLQSDGVCVKETVSQPTYFCPTGFTLDSIEGVCKSTMEVTVPFTLSCQPTFTLTGHVCTKIETAVPVFSCPDANQILDGAFCYGASDIVEPAIKICANENTDGQCEQTVYTTPDYSCLTDYVLRPFSNECVRTTVSVGSDPSGVCVYGYIYDDGVCTKTETDVAVLGCPDASWTLDGSMCKRTLNSVIPSINCDTGDVLFENQCWSVESVSFDYSCGLNYIFNSSTLMCEQLGLIVEPLIHTCLPSYILEGTECALYDEQLVEKTCDNVSDRIIGDICYEETQEMSTPERTCQVGFTDTGIDCVRENSVLAHLSCSDSTYLYDVATNSCIQSLLSSKSPTSQCPTDHVAVSGRICEKVLTSIDSGHRCNAGYSYVFGTCQKTSIDSKNTGYCEAGFDLVTGQCERRSLLPYTLSCSTPSVKELNKCLIKTTQSQSAVEVCT